MTLDQLKYALELRKALHFSNAARNCHISQPSLSLQIAKLEEELDLQLFVRTRTGVEITQAGEVLLRQARLILDESERLVQMSQELKGRIQGPFRLGIIPTLAPTLLPHFAGEFQKGHPDVELMILEERTERLVRDIENGDLDAALMSTPLKAPEMLLEKTLGYEPFVLLFSQGHPLLQKKKISVDQISADEILLLDETHCLRDQVLQLCKKQNSQVGSRHLRLQSASLQTLIEFIRSSEGYTLLPALAMSFLTPSEKTQVIRHFERPLPTRKISLVFNRSRLKRAVIEALFETLQSHLPAAILPVKARQDIRVLSPDLDHFEI